MKKFGVVDPDDEFYRSEDEFSVVYLRLYNDGTIKTIWKNIL